MRRKQPDQNCDLCGGTGETLAYVYSADSHTHEPTGTAPCMCTIEDEGDDHDDQGTGGDIGKRPWEPTDPRGTDTGGTETPVPSPISADDLIVT